MMCAQAVPLWVVETSEKSTYSVSLLPDGSIAAIAGIRSILVVDGRRGSRLHELTSLGDRPLVLPQVPSCVQLLSATQLMVGTERMLVVYDVQEVRTHACSEWSPDEPSAHTRGANGAQTSLPHTRV